MTVSAILVAASILLAMDLLRTPMAQHLSGLGARWREWLARRSIEAAWETAHLHNEAFDRIAKRVGQLRRCEVCAGREANGDICLYYTGDTQCGYDAAQRLLALCRSEGSPFTHEYVVGRIHENYVQTQRLRTNASLEQERRSAT